MSEKNKNRLHTVCGIVTAVLVLAAGVCFIASCLSIYQSGEKPFSPESVAVHFKAIRIPVIACVTAVIVSAVLALFFPVDASKTRAVQEEADSLAALKAKAGTLTDEKLAADATREQTRRKYLAFFTFAVYTGTYIRLYLLFSDSANFTVENLNQNILYLLLTIMVYTMLLLGAYVLRVCLTKRSLLREIAVYKAAIAEKKCDGIAPAAKAEKDPGKTVLIARCALCAVAVVFIVLGIFNGGIQDVLGKAIAICTECIGLG